MATVPRITGLYKINSVLGEKSVAVSAYRRYSNPTEAITRQTTKGKNITKPEFEAKMQELNSGLAGMTREGYEIYQRSVNTLTDAYIAANKVKRCTAEQDHAMSALVASWG